jgi:hypothetical protein
MERLLRQALPRIEDDAELSRDLWPAMRQRLHAAESVPAMVRIPWFDWALMGGLVAMVVAFPAAIPMLLYYL